MNRTLTSLFLRTLSLICASGFACAQNLGRVEVRIAADFLMLNPNGIDLFVNTCKLKYGSSASDKVKNESVKIALCIEETISSFNLNSSLSRIRTASMETHYNAAFISALSSVCNNYVPRIKNCIQPFFVALQGCTDNVDDGFIESQEQAMSNALNYLCRGNGNHILKFLTEGGQKCLMLSSAQECTKINDRKTFQWEHFTNSPKNACMIQQDFNQCLVSKFYQCSGASRAAAIIFNEFIDILFNKAYCSSITNEGGTKLRNNDAIVLSFCLLIFIYNYRYFIL